MTIVSGLIASGSDEVIGLFTNALVKNIGKSIDNKRLNKNISEFVKTQHNRFLQSNMDWDFVFDKMVKYVFGDLTDDIIAYLKEINPEKRTQKMDSILDKSYAYSHAKKNESKDFIKYFVEKIIDIITEFIDEKKDLPTEVMLAEAVDVVSDRMDSCVDEINDKIDSLRGEFDSLKNMIPTKSDTNNIPSHCSTSEEKFCSEFKKIAVSEKIYRFLKVSYDQLFPFEYVSNADNFTEQIELLLDKSQLIMGNDSYKAIREFWLLFQQYNEWLSCGTKDYYNGEYFKVIHSYLRENEIERLHELQLSLLSQYELILGDDFISVIKTQLEFENKYFEQN